MKRIASSVLAVCACVCVVQREACAIERVDFNRDVRSILSDKCFACHGPDENHREGDLRLDDQDSVFANRDGYSIVKPGSADESELIARVESDDPDMVMPPTDSGKEPTPKEISLLRRWVSEGAEWKRHWSFEPPTRPKPPETDSDWAINEIDSFIEKHLSQFYPMHCPNYFCAIGLVDSALSAILFALAQEKLGIQRRSQRRDMRADRRVLVTSG